MASQQLAGSKKKSRHLIREIALDPLKFAYDIDLEILVDKKKIHKLQIIEKGKTLCWDDLYLPCDVEDTSTVTIQVTEIHIIRDKVESHAYTASQVVEQDRLSIDRGSGRFMVKLRFMSGDEIEQAYRDALAKLQYLETRPSMMEKLGRAGRVFKGLLRILDLTGGPKAVVALCSKAWEYFEASGKLETTARQLIESLANMVPSIEDIKSHAHARPSEAVQKLVELIEDVSLFILAYKSRGTPGKSHLTRRFVSSTIDWGLLEQMQIISGRFRMLKEAFGIRVGTQMLGTVQYIATEDLENAIRSKLQPANLASYNPTRVCMTGTRVRIMREVTSWALTSNEGQRFAWIFGSAGLGKSSIAASLCELLDKQHNLGASFFCHQDHPELRDPCIVITTIAYSLAIQWKAYGDEVTGILQSDPELHTQHIQPQYEALLARPLRELAMTKSPANDLFVVVDALNECEDARGRRWLLTCLRDMSQIAPWLKVVVTSRPDPDIQDYFGRGETDWFTAYNLLDYDAGVDIRLFITQELSNLVQIKELINEAILDQLSDMSSGLFIWARTACDYIADSRDSRELLDRVLSQKHGGDSSLQLDSLYATAVKAGALGDDEDNLADILKFLGVIVATATRTPLSIPDMSRLLRGRISEYSLEHMLDSLRSVIYSDPNRGYVVRISHPSFIDYITDKRRSKELHVDLDEQNSIFTRCCLETMMSELKFNICHLETSDALNKDAAGLDTRIQDQIRPHLCYSCVYWTSHLACSGGKIHAEYLQEFLFDPTLLYWIEVLSLLGHLRTAVLNMLSLSSEPSIPQDLRAYANDVYWFISSFYDAICASTPHLYISALPMAPPMSLLVQRMRPYFLNAFEIMQSAEQDWELSVQTIWLKNEVCSVAWSNDGQLVATGSRDDTVRVWEAAAGTLLLGPIPGHLHSLLSYEVSSESCCVAFGTWDNPVRVWDTLSLRPIYHHLDIVLCVAFSPDGNRIASGSHANTVQIWDAVTGVSLFTLVGHLQSVYSVMFSPDGSHIASGSADASVRLWSAKTGTALLPPLEGHLGTVFCLVYASDSIRLASGSGDQTIRLWDTTTGTALLKLKMYPSTVRSLAFLPNNRELVSGAEDGTVTIWDTETGALILKPLLGHTAPVLSVAFSPKSNQVLSGSQDETVRIWNIGSRDTRGKGFSGHSGSIQCVVCSPDGCQIASSSNDKTIRIWNAETGAAVLAPMNGHSNLVLSISYSADGNRLVSGSADATICIWDTKTGASMLGLLRSHSGRVNSAVFSPDGSLIASGSDDRTVQLWNTSTGANVMKPLEGHDGNVYSVAFSPDGCYLASGSEDKTVRLWHVETGAAVFKPLNGHSKQVRSVAFSSSGDRLISGSDDGTAQVWDAATGVPLLEISQEQNGGLQSVSFSPDSLHILSFSSNGSIQVWNAQTGKPQYELLKGHSGGSQYTPCSASFLLGGHRLVSGTHDCTVRIWDLDTCARADSQSRRLLPDTQIPLTSGSRDSELVSTSSLLARHADSDGWVRTSDGGLYVWLPLDLRRVDDSSICISSTPPRARVVMDFSRFVHGREWQSVAKP